jgi:hypothetical protein
MLATEIATVASTIAIALLLTTPVEAQSGLYLRQYAAQPLRGQKDPFVMLVEDAKTQWATGQTKVFTPVTSACMEYRVSLTLNSDFVSVTITNPNVCLHPTCLDSEDGYDPCMKPVPLDNSVVCPFSLEWIDRSTTAVYTLPTRQNVPTNIAMEPLSIAIPQALDRDVVTDLMELRISIVCRETTLITHTIPRWFYTPAAPDPTQRDSWAEFDRSAGQHVLGMRLYWKVVSDGSYITNYHDGNFDVFVYFNRKKSSTPFTHKMRIGYGCEYNYAATLIGRVINNCGWFTHFYYFPTAPRTWVQIHEVCTAYTCANRWSYPYVNPSLLVWEYYEDYRQHKSNITLNFNILVAATKNPATGYSVTHTPTNGEYAMKFRFTWRDVIDNTTGMTNSAIDTYAYTYCIGLYLVPPFAVQDVWVTVHNELGIRIFTEFEKRVPYRKGLGDGPGQLGWPTALNNYYTGVGSSSLVNVMVRYNRQSKLGDTEEEKRTALLRGFVEDNDGDVTQIVSPIPKSILSESGVMGAVAANAIPAGKQFAVISWQSCLTSNISESYYWTVIGKKLNRTAGWFTQGEQEVVNVTAPWHRVHIIMTLMLVTDVVSQQDYTTAFWTISDAFYPQEPTMLPHFWPSDQVMRLFGFSEIPTFIANQLGQWTSEHNILCAAWPWFQKEVKVTKWRNFRAHVLRSTFELNRQLFLPPFLHLMRHSSTVPPNVDLWSEWSSGTINLTATTNIPKDGELFVNFHPELFYKHEYLLRYGAVPPTSKDGCTLPGYDGYLDLKNESRTVLVQRYMLLYSETYIDALARLLTDLMMKQASLPLWINGFGSAAAQVHMAAALLTSEKTVLAYHIADGWMELQALKDLQDLLAQQALTPPPVW